MVVIYAALVRKNIASEVSTFSRYGQYEGGMEGEWCRTMAHNVIHHHILITVEFPLLLIVFSRGQPITDCFWLSVHF